MLGTVILLKLIDASFGLRVGVDEELLVGVAPRARLSLSCVRGPAIGTGYLCALEQRLLLCCPFPLWPSCLDLGCVGAILPPSLAAYVPVRVSSACARTFS